MELPQALPRGHVPLLGLLLAVSLITFWIPSSTAQLTIESLPTKVGEGMRVLLIVHNMPENPVRFKWYKGKSVAPDQLIARYETATNTVITGPVTSGREVLYTNGSLLLWDVNAGHSGYYTLQVIKRDLQNEAVTGELEAYTSFLVTWFLPITAELSVESPVNAAEGKDALLHVYSMPPKTIGYFWYRGKSVGYYPILGYEVITKKVISGPAYSGRGTVYHNGSLLIQRVRQTDTGYYSLYVLRRGFRNKEVTVQLRVHKSVVRPSIHVRNTTITNNDPVSLSCLTADTEVTIQWFFNGQSLRSTDRIKFSLDNRTLIIDPFRCKDAGDYQCEVSNLVSSSNSDIVSLQVISGGDCTDLSGWLIAGIASGVLVVVVLSAALAYFLFFKRPNRTSGQCALRGEQPPKSNTDCNLYSNTDLSEVLQEDTDIYYMINYNGDMDS